jgi:hypothetical protein
MRSWLLISSQQSVRRSQCFEFTVRNEAFRARNARSPSECKQAKIAFAIATPTICNRRRVATQEAPRVRRDPKRTLLQPSQSPPTLAPVANNGKALLLPPVIPNDRARLDRAITLLGCRARGELGTSARAELTELVGRYPDAAVAMSWKRSLKQVRDDEIFDARDSCHQRQG